MNYRQIRGASNPQSANRDAMDRLMYCACSIHQDGTDHSAFPFEQCYLPRPTCSSQLCLAAPSAGMAASPGMPHAKHFLCLQIDGTGH
jgi:hypothetical protein